MTAACIYLMVCLVYIVSVLRVSEPTVSPLDWWGILVSWGIVSVCMRLDKIHKAIQVQKRATHKAAR